MTSSPAFILTSPDDWENWYDYIRIHAESRGIWDFMDPDQSVILNRPVEPLFEYDAPAAIPLPADTDTPTEPSTGGPASDARAAGAAAATASALPMVSSVAAMPREPEQVDESICYFKQRQIPRPADCSTFEWFRLKFLYYELDLSDHRHLLDTMDSYSTWSKRTLSRNYLRMISLKLGLRMQLRELVYQVKPVRLLLRPEASAPRKSRPRVKYLPRGSRGCKRCSQ